MSDRLAVIFMGVCGAGKTTMATKVAQALRCEPVIEADQFHTPEMKKKMHSGIPLTDEDRWPWLDRLNQAMRESIQSPCVVTCSALRRAYRERLVQNIERRILFIFLDAPERVIRQRLMEREHEFMSPSLLRSQLSTLERPDPDEPITTIPVSGSEDETFDTIMRALSQQ